MAHNRYELTLTWNHGPQALPPPPSPTPPNPGSIPPPPCIPGKQGPGGCGYVPNTSTKEPASLIELLGLSAGSHGCGCEACEAQALTNKEKKKIKKALGELPPGPGGFPTACTGPNCP